MTSLNFRLIGSEVDCFKKLVYETLTFCEHVSRHHLHFYRISARSDLKYGRQAAILENQQSAITPELMAGSSPNFYHTDIR
jgi:hypothetical protein